MANDKDFVVAGAVEVGKDTKVTLGSITSSDIDLATGNYFADTLAANTTYTLSNAGDVQAFQLEVTGSSTSSYLEGSSYASKYLSVGAQEAVPEDVSFKPDGTKMYFAGGQGDDVNEYDLSTPWDVSTGSFVQNFSLSSQSSSPKKVSFKSDGTKMFALMDGNNAIYQYTLSTPWSVATASYDSVSVSVAGQSTSPSSMFFKPDGTKIYMCDISNSTVYQYSLSTAWDLSTFNYDSKSFSVSSQFTQPTGISFSSDGTTFVSLNDSTHVAYQYTLSTPWDVSTASYSNISLDFSVFCRSAKGITFGDSDFKFYISSTSQGTGGGSVDKSVYQFDTGVSSRTITWPSSIEWKNGLAPLAPATGETDLYTFLTDDGGTSYVGLKTADNIS